MNGGPLCNRNRPRPALSGLTVTDVWGTAAAEAHPSGLCKVLASTLLQEARARFPEARIHRLGNSSGLALGTFAPMAPGGMRWTMGRDTFIRDELNFESAGDDGSLPTGLWRSYTSSDPYMVSTAASDCMIHAMRGRS